jgi:PadR family transcriptional regulator, regulatory protein PadR
MTTSNRLDSELMRGSLDLMVLSVLAAGPGYGYSIAQSLRETTGGMVDVRAGTLYPLLHRLEADKLVRCRWDETTGRRRKWYDLTPKGRRRLDTQAREWERYATCLRRVLTPVLDA